MTSYEKIKILEEVLGSYNSWVIQAKRFIYADEITFDIIYNTMVQSTLADLENQLINIQEKIKKLENTLN